MYLTWRKQIVKIKKCKICGKTFETVGSRITCSPECAKANQRNLAKESNRKRSGIPVKKFKRNTVKLYADKGYQLRNVSLGGQGENRASGSIGERKAPKGYMQGIQQGKKVLARELSSIAEKHLKIEIRDDKKHNKVSQKQYDKFMDLISEDSYEDRDN